MSTNLSVISLIAQADIVVKLVLLFLLIVSVFSWSIIFKKIFNTKFYLREVQNFTDVLKANMKMESIKNSIRIFPDSFMKSMFLAAIEKLKKTDSKMSDQKKIKEFLNKEFQKAENQIESGVDLLATTASASPFIGLFGTVWGIMHSFQTIGIAKTTTLAVVAPSIAEALLATAAGLFVAIPALIFYNYINHMVDNLNKNMGILINEFLDVISNE